MHNILYGLLGLMLLLGPVTQAKADISIGIGLPSVNIGINLPLFPKLVPVPGYPVYYAPSVEANYFFYDGMYWIYQNDGWHSSSWYNGPWWPVEPELVPLYILRVPVRYYRQPPEYFHGWRQNAPPRWGQHWGSDWENRRSGWDHWKRSSTPRRAPLPVYQRKYSGDRYPHQVERQHQVRSQRYRYQPRDRAVRENFRRQAEHRPAAVHPERGRHDAPPMAAPQHREAPRQHDRPRPEVQQRAPEMRDQHQQRRPDQQQRAPGRDEKHQRQHERDDSRGRHQDQDRHQDRDRGQGPDKDDERGRGHNK